LKKLVKEQGLEIITLVILLIGVLLLFHETLFPSPPQVETGDTSSATESSPTLLERIGAGLKRIGDALKSATTAIGNYFGELDSSEWLGWILVVVATVLLVTQRRDHFLRSTRWVDDICPQCGDRIQRVHRTRTDRLINAILRSHLRRYRCPNPECGWSGLRHGEPHGRRSGSRRFKI
jgi:predicted RNA-binding Zn-ribbon protein involved in translation (DUF1610 family)